MTAALVLLLLLSFSQATIVQAQELHDEGRELVENDLKGPIAPALEKKLPVRPADLRDRNKEVNKQIEEIHRKSAPNVKVKDREDPSSLKGELKTGGILSHAEPLKDSPLSRYKGSKLKFYAITVSNNTDKPMLILGSQSSFSKASALASEPPRQSLDASTLEASDNNLLTPGKKVAIGLASAGTLGFAGPLTYEFLTPSENRKRSLGIALGRDRGRHEVEGERFGLRLVMPGDNTVGWAAFKANTLLTGDATKIYVPVMYPPYTKISEILIIPVGKKDKLSSLESFVPD